MQNALHPQSNIENRITLLVVKVNQVTMMNVYKPSNAEWSFPIPTYEHPAVYIGDFNSHHQLWKYSANDKNGEFIVDWALQNGLHLSFDAKDNQTFHSRTW